MTKAQKWLTNTYPNKQLTTKILFDGKILLEGDLVIEDFPKLETIVMPDGDDLPERMSNLPNVQIRNCPQLKQIKINYFEVQNFSISNCPQVEKLNLETNSLTALDISELTNLKVLECDDDLKPKILWKNGILRWRTLTNWKTFKERFRGSKEARLFANNKQKESLNEIKREANRQENNPQWGRRFDILKSMINKLWWAGGGDSTEPTIEEVIIWLIEENLTKKKYQKVHLE